MGIPDASPALRANAPDGRCVIDGACRLERVLEEAQRAFLGALDAYTLADVAAGKTSPLRRLLTGGGRS